MTGVPVAISMCSMDLQQAESCETEDCCMEMEAEADTGEDCCDPVISIDRLDEDLQQVDLRSAVAPVSSVIATLPVSTQAVPPTTSPYNLVNEYVPPPPDRAVFGVFLI